MVNSRLSPVLFFGQLMPAGIKIVNFGAAVIQIGNKFVHLRSVFHIEIRLCEKSLQLYYSRLRFGNPPLDSVKFVLLFPCNLGL